MGWFRNFTLAEGHNPAQRNLEDAPQPMRQELVDLFFSLSEHNPNLLDPRLLHRIISQSLGIQASGEPYGGFRYAVGRDIDRVEWHRVYDVVARLWPEVVRSGLTQLYLEGANRIFAGHGVAWQLSTQGRLERVLPGAAHAQVVAAFAELSHPAATPALQLFNAARDAYDDRPRRDRDACANIFDALESVAKIKYQRPNETFGQVKNHMEQTQAQKPEALSILTALNQIRNKNFGHGMSTAFALSPGEVDFVYLTCISAILLLVRT